VIAWNVVGGPLTPNAAQRVRVVAEQSATPHGRGRADPLEWRRRSSRSQVKRRGIGARSTKEDEISRMDRQMLHLSRFDVKRSNEPQGLLIPEWPRIYATISPRVERRG